MTKPADLARLRSLLRYEPETGHLYWIKKRQGCNRNKPAGVIGRTGYVRIEVDRRHWQAHRLIWVLVTGALPVDQIDHINGDRADNRWCNLRQANPFQNMGNRPVQPRTSSGIKGVRISSSGKYTASINARRVYRYLGSFDRPEDAAEAYRTAALNTYGEFAWRDVEASRRSDRPLD